MFSVETTGYQLLRITYTTIKH